MTSVPLIISAFSLRLRPAMAIVVMGLAMLSGCAVNPSTGRNQLMALPAAQKVYADTGYTIATMAQGLVTSSKCARAAAVDDANDSAADEKHKRCPSTAALSKFTLQVQRIGDELADEAILLVPELHDRIGTFQIGLSPELGAGTVSSAGGRIALDTGLAALDPTDDVVAFLIAREMGHVIARHGEEDSGARIAFSAITTFVPIGGLLVKFAASLLGSQALKASWAGDQRREADEIALTLLERCERSPGVIALNLRIAGLREQVTDAEWNRNFAESIERVVAIAVARRQATQLAAVKLRAGD